VKPKIKKDDYRFLFYFHIYIWLNLLTDESHFSSIFLPMVASLATKKIPGKNTAQKMNASGFSCITPKACPANKE
jgi:hypothetical protein